MSAPRLASLPFEHLIAEMAAFPLASEAAFRLNVLTLNPSLQGPTGDLWREAERALRLPAFSLEELIALRDLLWFPDSASEALTLDKYLRRQAQRFLAPGGRGLLPRLEGGGSEARARWVWRWLTFSLPPDLLVAGFSPAESSPSSSDTVLVLSPTLERLLQHCGYAQLHLHLGAAVDFADLWAGAMWALSPLSGSAKPRPSDFQSPGADFKEGRDLHAWLVRAAVVRVLLAWFLHSRSRGRGFDKFIHDLITQPPSNQKRIMRTVLMEFSQSDRYWSSDRRANDREVQNLYDYLLRFLYGYRGWPKPHRIASVLGLQELDPIYVLFRGQLRGTTPEGRFLREAFRYLQGEGTRDREFCGYFWQVVRLRNLFYRHVVQRPLTPGLHWFIRFFSRIKPARAWGQRFQVERAFLQDGHLFHGSRQLGLRSLEVRTSPKEDRQGLRDLIKELEEGTRRFLQSFANPYRKSHQEYPQDGIRHGELPELGLILHFTKGRGGGMRTGRPRVRWEGERGGPKKESAQISVSEILSEEKERSQSARLLSLHVSSFPSPHPRN